MLKPIVYLCGPIMFCSPEEAGEWREDFKRLWGADYCLDPYRRPYEDPVANTREIVELDKVDIERSDVLLVNFSLEKPRVGTIMEVLYGWERGKMIITYAGDLIISPWLRYHTHYFVPSFRAAIGILTAI